MLWSGDRVPERQVFEVCRPAGNREGCDGFCLGKDLVCGGTKKCVIQGKRGAVANDLENENMPGFWGDLDVCSKCCGSRGGAWSDVQSGRRE